MKKYSLINIKEFLNIYWLNIKHGAKIYCKLYNGKIEAFIFDKSIKSSGLFYSKMIDQMWPLFKIIH
jgi:hypothetical protein